MQNISFADDEMLLKSDFKNAYLQYNQALNEAKTPLNYLNMCKLTFLLRDDDSAKTYCKSALKEIDKQKHLDYELKSEILSMMGNVYSLAFHNNDIAFEYYNQAKEYKERNSETDKYDLTKLYRNLAYTYYNTGNINMADLYWDKAFKTIEEQNEDKYMTLKAVLYNDMAMKERKNQKYDKSKEYLDKALEAALNAKEYKDHRILSTIYGNLAYYYEVNKKDKKLAVKYNRLFLEESSKFPEENLIDKDEYMPEDTTIEDIEKLLEEYPYDIDLNVMLGAYKINLEESNSKDYFDNAIRINPDNTYVYLAIANAYSEKYQEYNFKEYLEQAKKYAQIAAEKSHYEPDVYLTLGLININLNAPIVANMYFNNYIKNTDDKAEAYCDVASVFWYNVIKMKYREYVVYYL